MRGREADVDTTGGSDPGSHGTGSPGRSWGSRRVLRSRGHLVAELARIGGFLAVWGVMFLYFSLQNPDFFPTWENVTFILRNASVLIVLALGLTIVLIAGEFDLSFAAVATASGAVAVLATIANHGGTPVLSIVIGVGLALLFGLGVGLLNGLVITVLRVNALIGTLGMSTVLAGVTLALDGGQQQAFGLPADYNAIASTSVLGLPTQVWIALVLCALCHVFIYRTTAGRYIRAVGGSPQAAEVAGIDVRRWKIVAFMVAGTLAAIAGLLLTSSAGAHIPGEGTSYLLPAFAAAFLGNAIGGGTRFSPTPTVAAALFMGTLSTGITSIAAPAYVNSIIQGTILIIAVAVSAALRRGPR